MKRIIPIIYVIAVSLVACNGNSKHVKAAKQLGEKHANEIITQDLPGNKLAVKLLDVRAKEHQMRTLINDQVADAYIESFTSYIKLNDDSLASIIFAVDTIDVEE